VASGKIIELKLPPSPVGYILWNPAGLGCRVTELTHQAQDWTQLVPSGFLVLVL
jgi:hypothetical protein